MWRRQSKKLTVSNAVHAITVENYHAGQPSQRNRQLLMNLWLLMRKTIWLRGNWLVSIQSCPSLKISWDLGWEYQRFQEQGTSGKLKHSSITSPSKHSWKNRSTWHQPTKEWPTGFRSTLEREITLRDFGISSKNPSQWLWRTQQGTSRRNSSWK